MAQDITSIYQDPLFPVFLDIRKSYNMLGFGRLLQTLKGNRTGLKIWGILEDSWDKQ